MVCLTLLHLLARSEPSLGPPTDAQALQVAYEAGLWQLLDLFFLSEDTQEGYFTEAIAAWLAEHGGLLSSTPGYDTLAADARRLAGAPRIDNEPTYWPTVQRLVLIGQLEAAGSLLMAHPAYKSLQDPGMAAQVCSMVHCVFAWSMDESRMCLFGAGTLLVVVLATKHAPLSCNT